MRAYVGFRFHCSPNPNLAFAIVGRAYEFDDLSPDDLYEKAIKLVETLIPTLEQHVDHDVTVNAIRTALGDGQRPIFD